MEELENVVQDYYEGELLEYQQKLSDLEADNLIENYKETMETIERLNKLSKEKIEQIKDSTEKSILPLKNKINYIEEQLKVAIMNDEKKEETKTLWKKRFVSGEIHIKKPQEKIKNPELKGAEAFKNDKLKDYCEKITDYKFNWGELKKKLNIVEGKVVNTETGEEFSDIVEIEYAPAEVVVKV